MSQYRDNPHRQSRRHDLAAGVALFLFAAAVGGGFTAYWGAPSYWQIKYGPAAMLALGRGYFNPDLDAVPALKDFFAQNVSTLDVRVLPAVIPALPEFDPMQLLYLYTQLAIAAVWAVAGVSWPAVYVLFALLYGLTGLSAYGLFRLLMRRALAIPLTMLFCTSALQLAYLQWLRDYGKVPLIFGLVFILGLLAGRPYRGRGLILLGAAYGAITGVGLGCRDDMMAMLPLFPIAALFFVPGGLKRSLWPRLGTIAAMAAVFLVCAAPILYFRTQTGACTGDHVYLGLLDRCSGRLGVGGAPYRFGGPYSDTLMIHLTQNYAQRVLGWSQAPPWYSLEYDRAGSTLVGDLLRTFPADFATRACAAVWRVLDGFLPAQANPAPGRMLDPVLIAFFQVHLAILWLLGRLARYQILAALLLLAARNWRQGLFALLLGLYLFGLAAIQFNLRHHVHWAIVGLLAAGYLVEQALQWGGVAWRERRFSPPVNWKQWVAGPVLAGVIAAIIIPGTLFLLRDYQQGRVEELFQNYERLSGRPLEMTSRSAGAGHTRLSIPGFARMEDVPPERQTWPAHAALLALDFEGPSEETPLIVEYTPSVPGTDHPGTDLTWTMKTPALRARERVRVYLPIYYATYSRFDGIILTEHAAACLRAVHGEEEESRLPRLLLFAMLRPEWRTRPLYVTIAGP